MKNYRKRSRKYSKPAFERLELRQMLASDWITLANPLPTPNGIGTMMLLTDGTVMAQEGGVSKRFFKLTPDSTGNYHNGTWSSLASMSLERLYTGSNVLPTGEVFVLGGEYSGPNGSATWVNSGEMYNPVLNSWSAIPNFPQSNFGDDPTVLLPNGKILAGYLSGPQTYLFDPVAKVWSQTGSKLHGDSSDEETWVLLPDGSVLTADVFVDNRAQRYVPSTGTWVDAGTVPVILTGSAFGFEMGPATLLPDGRVLQLGANNNSAIYTPSTNSWVAGPTLPAGWGADDAPGAMLPNGHFVFAVDQPLFNGPTKIFDFDYTTNTFADITPAALSADLNQPAFISRMLVLPNGNMLMTTGSNTLYEYVPPIGGNVLMQFEGIAGGTLLNINPANPLIESGFQIMPTNSNSAVFDPGSGTTFSGDSTAFFGFAADNPLLLTEQAGKPFSLNSITLGPISFGAPTSDITLTGNLSGGGTLTKTFFGLSSATLETLNWTDLVSVNMTATTDSAMDDISLSRAGIAIDPAWAPTINGISYIGSNVYNLTGTQLNGISEGASYGDDAEMSSNYPIVKITDSSGIVTYARSFGWTPGVATGNAIVSTNFLFPPSLPFGFYTINVIANGISSLDFPFLKDPQPLELSLIGNNVNENLPGGTLVGSFATLDPNGASTFTYSLVPGVGSDNNNEFNLIGDKLFTKAPYDYETQGPRLIRAKTVDTFGLSVENTFTITINDVNEAPTGFSMTKRPVPENLLPGFRVGVLSASDPDVNDQVTFRLVELSGSNDNALFQIVGNELQTAVTFDFEQPRTSFNIEVEAIDRGGLFTSLTSNIVISDINEKPVDIQISQSEILENQPSGTVIGLVNGIDLDAGDSTTLSLVAGTGSTDNSRFRLVNVPGVGVQLISQTPFDYETQRLFSIRVRAADRFGLAFEKVLTISVLNVNENPVSISLSPATVNESLPIGTTIGTLTTLEPDLADTYTYEIKADPLYPDNSKFQINGDQLQTAAVFNFDVKNNYTIRVRSKDQGGLFVDQVLTVVVNNVNEKPSDILLSNAVVAENLSPNTFVGTFSTTDPDLSDSFSYSLATGIGGGDNANFSLIGNQLFTTKSFDFEGKPSHSIRIETKDSGGLTLEKVFTINVTNVNEAPTAIALTSSSVSENSPIGTSIGSFTSTDPDAGDSFAYTLVTGAGSSDNSKFQIVGNVLKTLTPLDFETKGQYSVRIKSTDLAGLSFETAFVISVLDVNEAPANINSTVSLVENAPLGQVLGSFTATDQDAGDVLTYTLISGVGSTDNASFALSPNGTLKLQTVLDFETKSSYNVRVHVADIGGLFVEKAFVLSVADVNEVPTQLLLSNTSIAENSGTFASIGSLSTIDQDVADSFTYSLVSGSGSTDNGSFTLVGNQLVAINSFDFESKNSYSVRIRTTDAGGLSLEQPFSITVQDIAEAPTALQLSKSQIDENLPSGSLVGLFASTDVDTNESFTYSLVSGAGSTNNSQFSIAGNRLQANAAFDFETKSSYSIRVRTTDRGGLTFEAPFVIQVNDKNDLPTNLSLSSQNIDENTAAGVLVGILSSTDQDAGDVVSYQLVSGFNDNVAFTLSGTNQKELRIVAPFNFELKSTYKVEIQAIDSSLTGPTQTFTITVNDVNDPVTDLLLSATKVDENVPSGTLVGSITPVDEDAIGSYQFSLVSGAGSTDNSKFSLINNELHLATSPNFESQSSYSIRLRGEQGGTAFEKSFVISVGDLPESPSGLGLNNTHISENSPTDSLVGTIGATDPDIGDHLTYTLENGLGSSDNSSFLILGDRLIARPTFNYEAKQLYSVRIRATDLTNRFVESTFSISVDNVNEPPTSLSLSKSSVLENQAVSTLVGTLSAADPDAGDTFTYSLIPSVVNSDFAKFEIVGNQLRTKRVFNFEAQSSYQMRVRTTDSAGLSIETPITISIGDVTEAAPNAVGDIVKTTINTPIIINVLANDQTPGAFDPSTMIVTAPTAGTIRLLVDGKIEYTPPKDARSVDTFTYTVKDDNNQSTNAASVTVTTYSGHQNLRSPLDVDADGSITPLDILTIVNDLNTKGPRILSGAAPTSPPYLDTNGNGQTDPLDVLEVLNYLNSHGNLASGEGESSRSVVDDVFATVTNPDTGVVRTSVATSAVDLASLSTIDEYYRELAYGKNKRR